MNNVLHNWKQDLRIVKKIFLKIKTKKNSEWKINFMKKILLDWGSNHKTAKCLGLKPGALAH